MDITIHIVRLPFTGLILSLHIHFFPSQSYISLCFVSELLCKMASTSAPSNYLQRNLHSYNSSQKLKPFSHEKTPLNLSFLLPASTKPLVFLRTNSSNATKYNEVVVDDEMDRVRRLQNGSDVRGVAVEGEKGRTVDLTTPVAEAIAESFGEWVIDLLFVFTST